MWNHLPEYINPVFINLGPIQIRYYGLMYCLSFIVIYALILYRLKKKEFSYTREMVDDYFFWGILSIIIGSRIGYVIFYNFAYFVQNPLQIFLPFEFSQGVNYIGISGMSYHGGLLGVALTTIWFCKHNKISFWEFSDFIVPAAPIGYAFGRLGNFLNGELFGRVTSMPWGMYFPTDITHQLRHPSQLYEMFFEGIVLFLILWAWRKKAELKGHILAVYIIGYGTVRYFIEFYRQPDAHIGYIYSILSVGQILCLIMIGFGIFLLYRQKIWT